MALRSTPKKAKRRGRPGPVADRSGAITGLETWYHGGKPGLGVAAVLKPRNMLADWAGKTVRYRTASPIDRKAEEYLAVTQDLDLARYYASIYVGPTDHHEPGDVYSVRLYSHPQIDPDHDRFFPRVAHTGPSTVIAVIETGVVLSPQVATQFRAPYLLWAVSEPVYDADGYLQPSPRMQARGLTASDLRKYGPWMPFERLTADGDLRR